MYVFALADCCNVCAFVVFVCVLIVVFVCACPVSVCVMFVVIVCLNCFVYLFVWLSFTLIAVCVFVLCLCVI